MVILTYIEVINQILAEQKGINKSCKYIAEQLENKWGWKHIYNIYKGLSTPSNDLIEAIERLQGLPTIKEVNLQEIDGEIKDGSMAFSSKDCIQCGKPFVSNSGKRRKCPKCVPYRDRSKDGL